MPANISSVGRRVAPYSEWMGSPVACVGRRRHVLVEDAADAVLGAEERHEREVLLRVQKIDRGRAVAARPV